MRKSRVLVLVFVMAGAMLTLGYIAARQSPSIAMPQSAHRAATPTVDIAKGTPRTDRIARVIAPSPVSPASIKHETSSAAAPALKDIFSDLKSRADAGDADAASELYRDLGKCARTKELAASLPKIIPAMLDRDTSTASAETLSRRDSLLANMQTQLSYVERNQPFCAGLDDATLQQYVPATLKAAQLGDVKAARCYLGGEMTMAPGLLDHPEWLGDFKQNAMTLADRGIQQGDWGIAGLLGHAYAGFFASSFLTQMTGTDPAKAYQYLKLQRLGADGAFTDKLDSRLNTAAQELTPDQIAQADQWAQSTYDAHFAGSSSNELSNGVNTCGGFDD